MNGPDYDAESDWADEWDDADSDAYLNRVEAVTWSAVMRAWGSESRPVPARPLRELVLGALAEAVVTRRAGPVFCADCRPGCFCADHREDLARAREYEGAYMRVMRIGSDGAVLEILGGLTL